MSKVFVVVFNARKIKRIINGYVEMLSNAKNTEQCLSVLKCSAMLSNTKNTEQC